MIFMLHRMRELTGKENLPLAYNTRLDGYLRDGSTMKINLCLKGLPTFKCLPENRGQFGTTTHILPQGPDVIDVIRKAWSDCQQGKLPEFPSIEWYIHTTVDKSIQDTKGHHSSALFVQWVPYELKGTTWEKEEKKYEMEFFNGTYIFPCRYVQHMLSILDQFAPGTSQLVVETFTLTPPKLEKHFGVTKGHIHHIDNSFGFADRLPYATPIKGLYSCSAGCHPAGSVIGCAGHNAAERVIKDLESGKIAPISKL